MSNILENLNDEQKRAVTHKGGPLMIIAGAGTGKTTVMTRRIAWLIEQGLAKPDEILALTFTEKAASEMEERVDKLLPYGYVDLWISTFHAFCQRILEQHGIDIGLANDATLVTETDAWLLMRQNFDKFDLDYYRPLGNPTKFLKALLQHFSRAKDEDIDPVQYREFVKGLASADEEEKARLMELSNAYNIYESILHNANALDFGGLIMYTTKLFRDRPAILKKYQEQFKYIIVDEFQDTNHAQYELVKLLAKGHENIAVVGDDDQGIYTFRGASISNILRFEDDYPNTDRVVLTKNYRSRQGILDAAYGFIQQNDPNRLEARLKESHGLDKMLESQILGDGIVNHLHAETLEGEVKQVIEKILDIKQVTECDWSDFAILVRANDTAEPFLQGLDMLSIPYHFMALRGLYRKPIVLDAISLLRIIDRPYDSTSVYRLLSHLHIGIPERDLVELAYQAKKGGKSMSEIVTQVIPDMSEEGGKRLREFSSFLEDMRLYARRKNALEVLAAALKQSGLYGSILQMSEEEQVEQMGFLQQFYERVKSFVQLSEHVSLHDFLNEFENELASGDQGSLQSGEQVGPDEIQVMTLHGAKGLEFRTVFLVSMVDQRFPSRKKSAPIPLHEGLLHTSEQEGDPHLEEERRLMYVGMTRAKEQLYMSSAEDYGGARKKKLSRFLVELGYDAPVPYKLDGEFLQETVRDRVKDAGITVPVPNTFSFTQLVAYGHCPLQYKFAHLLKIPVFGSHAMSFGKTMHNTLQRFFEEMVATGKMPSKKRMFELYNDNWIDDWYENDELREQYRKDGMDSIEQYYQELQETQPEPLFLERGFTVKIDDIVIRGRVDRIDKFEDGVEIVDYKTGTPKDGKKLSATDKMQLLLYQLAAKEIFELNPKKLTFHYLKDNSEVSFLGSDEDIQALRDKIKTSIDGIRNRHFDPSPGFHCQFCDFKDICPFKSAS